MNSRNSLVNLIIALIIFGLVSCGKQPVSVNPSTQTASSAISTSQVSGEVETPAYPAPVETASEGSGKTGPYPEPLEQPSSSTHMPTPYPGPGEAPASVARTPTPTPIRSTATKTPGGSSLLGSPTPTASVTSEEPYPPPVDSGGSTEGTPYPGPGSQEGQITEEGPYPGPEDTGQPPATITPSVMALTPSVTPITPSPVLGTQPTRTKTPILTTLVTPVGPLTNTLATQPITGTWTPMPIPPPASGEAGVVRIWLAWNESQVEILDQIIQAFQETYPDVRFVVQRVPFDDLLGSYETALYRGVAPALLFGPSDWGAGLYDRGLVANLSTLVSSSVQASIIPAARDTGRYRGAQVSLPYAMKGIVLYRNQRLIPSASATFQDLASRSRQATRGGVVGAFFDLGAYFTLGHLQGLGGQWLDDYGNPRFNELDYRYSLEWMNLIVSLRQAGAVEMNGNRDFNLFQQGKAGIIVDGSWNREVLAQAIGQGNLKIDPWPAYPNGHLSGFVQGESLYLNPALRSRVDLQAVVRFIEFLLKPENQTRLAEAGFIPSVKGAQPADPLIQQAMQGLVSGTAYPPAMQEKVRTAYWDALQVAIQDVLDRNITPKIALQKAYQDILTRMKEIK